MTKIFDVSLMAAVLALCGVWPDSATACSGYLGPSYSAETLVVAKVVGQNFLGESEDWWHQSLDLEIMDVIRGDLRGQNKDALLTVTIVKRKAEGEAQAPAYLANPYEIGLIWNEDPEAMRARGEYEFRFDMRVPIYDTFSVYTSNGCGNHSAIHSLAAREKPSEGTSDLRDSKPVSKHSGSVLPPGVSMSFPD